VAERTLARRRIQGLAEPRGPREQCLLFRVGSEIYGIGLRALWEVLLPEGVTGLPTPPYQVCTALAYRGRRLPLLRLGELFGNISDRVSPTARVVLIQAPGRPVGLLVDEVLEMVEVAQGALARVPTLATLLSPSLFRGLFRRGERIILVLNEEGLGALDEVARFEKG
jgi:chemotaxis signal transduction protein